MADFHFIRPLWLAAIIMVIVAIYLLKKYRISQSGWQQLLPKHLSTLLIDDKKQGKSLSLTLPFIIGTLVIIALAGPTWKKLPQPVYQVAKGSVIIMDMSYSMYATDLKPNRVTRARYKAIDLLTFINEGDIGLVAYAADAFTISPLTEDVNNIRLLLPSLTPDLMPEAGSNPLSAFVLAAEMLKNSGHVEGDIYWFTDGIDADDSADIYQWSDDNPYRINIMAVGTVAGAPIKLSNEQLMKDDNGAIIIPKLSPARLAAVTQRASGNFVMLKNDDSDIEQLSNHLVNNNINKKSANENSGDQWQEFGPYLLLVLLPLVLGYFRRGVLFALMPICLLVTSPKPVHADIWQDLWKTKDQQGQKSFNEKDFTNAAQQFNNPLWQGSAHYQAGDYQQALDAFEQGDSADALYNQGNALAKLQQLDKAIKAYDKALAKSPDHQDAKTNKALVEELKQQQQDQQDQESDNDQQQEQDSDDEQQGEQQGEKEQQDQQGNQQEKEQEQEQEQNSEQNKQQAEQNKEEGEAKEEQDREQETDAEQEQEQEQGAAKEQQNPEQNKQQGQITPSQQDQEEQQKLQQLLNKVTDDPYLLLRNKMQLEYQKRQNNRSSVGVKKKW